MVSGRTVILDCGASRTALGIFSRHGDRMRLDDFAVESAAFQTGGEEKWLEQTRAALRSLRLSSGAHGPVVLLLPAHLTLTKLIKTPRVAAAQREKVVRFEAEQSIPHTLHEVVWASLVVGETDTELDVLVAAAKLEVVEPLCAAAEDAGFAPGLVLPSSLATLAGYRLSHNGAPECALVLSQGARSATLLLVGAKGFAVRTFSPGAVGGSQPAVEDPDPAAGASPEPGQSGTTTGVSAEFPKSISARLAQEVVRSMAHFRAKAQVGSPTRIFLDENAARLPGLSGILATRLQLPVEVFAVRDAIDYAGEAIRAEVARQSDALVELAGGAAAQLWPHQPVLNLLPPVRQTRAVRRRRRPWLITAAIMAVAALVPPIVHFHRLAAAAQKKSAAFEHQLAPLRARDQRTRARSQRLTELREQVSRLDALSARRSSWLVLLAGLQGSLARVEDTWLERLQPLPMAGAGGTLRLEISGCLLDRTNPLSPAGSTAFGRVKELLAGFARAPLVVAIEEVRFDNSRPGILRFDCVLVTMARPAL